MDQKHSASAHQAEARSTARIYTKPELHERLKDEIMASDRGGQPGEWSARKAELLTHEYRQAGGGYTFAKRSPTLQPQAAPGSPQQPATSAQPTQPRQAWTDFAATPRPVGEPHDESHPATTTNSADPHRQA